MHSYIKKYIIELDKGYKTGNTTEHSYRGILSDLLNSIHPNIIIINEPKRIECGAPDYIITDKNNIPVGYIEAKDIGKSLDSPDLKEQFNRYTSSLDNIIFTNYLEFRYYVNGDFVSKVTIAEINKGKIKPLSANFNDFANIINAFFDYKSQTIKSPKKLSQMMANKARILANIVCNTLSQDYENGKNSDLIAQWEAFKQILIHDISISQFSDVYAQTIAYGLFAARLHDETLEDFSRKEAAELIPKSNPFLRKLFQHISGYDLDDRIAWVVDALVDVFRATNVSEILKNFGKMTGQSDPVIHFYETFLTEYDAKIRKSKGVWYTPEPVVNFIVRTVDDILKKDFELSEGLADTSKTEITRETYLPYSKAKNKFKKFKDEVHKVQILDPATGTGTFLAEVIKNIYRKFSGQEGMWNDYTQNHLIPRINGFELLIASYAIAHLKLELLLKETGFAPKNNDRLKIYLTNSLEPHHPDTGTVHGFLNWLSAEASEADEIKQNTPVMVVMGNPPYSGESSNKGKWIMNLMDSYKKEPGGKSKLNERNPKWINDDYVKFLRLGEYLIDKNSEGILAYINAHGFLDNPTFRGMRWHLLQTFDKIYIIDLHGNSKKKEKAPDGSKDENVFDIMQGVSINIFVKTKAKSKKLAKVYFAEVFGTRDKKNEFLIHNSIDDIPFKEIKPCAPMFYLSKPDLIKESEYDDFVPIDKIFRIKSAGIVTARDKLTISFKKETLEERLNEFVHLTPKEARKKFNLGNDVRDWKVSEAQKDITTHNFDEKFYSTIYYRPFDIRWTYYTGKTKGFHCMPRYNVMKHLDNHQNIALVSNREQKQGNTKSIFIVDRIIDGHLIDNISYAFSLYLYPDKDSHDTARQPNLNDEIVNQFEKNLNLTFTNEREEREGTFAPIDILDYIYAVLHSPTYREKYNKFLKVDFPRVPYPENKKIFWELVDLGSKLRQIHLLEHPKVDSPITKYPVAGNDVIENRITKKDFVILEDQPDKGRVFINDDQYFDEIPLVAWNFYIGGYQPAQKWLKSRYGEKLGYEDVKHYQKIIVALAETDRVMKMIDKKIYM